MENREIFWDKKRSKNEIQAILKDVSNPRFVEYAAILLTNTNDSKLVFNEYLDKERFVKYWNIIKRRMRQNKWNDSRIVYWNEFYRVIKKNSTVEPVKAKRKPKDKELAGIGRIIKQGRENKGMTQKDLAIATNLSQQTISFVERGIVNIRYETLKVIADVLGMNITITMHRKPDKMDGATTYTSVSPY